MTTQRDLTVPAIRRRALELGYSITSWTHPDRIVGYGSHAGNRASLSSLRDHPAAIQCYPTKDNGADVDDGDKRQLVELVITSYLLGRPKELKAMLAVAERYGLLSGPCYTDGFRNRCHVLQWNGDEPIYEQQRFRARECFDSDDNTIVLRQAIAPRYESVRNSVGGYSTQAVEAVGTLLIPVDADWKGQHIMDVPRQKLPELLQADAAEFVDACEVARWEGRPAASLKDAAA